MAEKLIDSTITLLLNQNYSEAQKKSLQLQQIDKNEPIGYLLGAIILQAENEDFRIKENLEKIKLNLKRATELAYTKKNIERTKRDGIYYYSLSKSLSCLYKLKYENKLEAIADGFSAYLNYNLLIKDYPDFIESYSGYSAAKYWKAKRFPFLTPLSSKEEKQEGIEGLINVYKNGKLEKYFALHYLIWILIEEKNYDNALDLITENQKIFPLNRVFIRAKMTIYSNKDEIEDLANSSIELLQSIKSSGRNNPHSEISALYNISKSKLKIKIINEYEKSISNIECQDKHSTCSNKLAELKKIIKN